jgi:hypothetical protein
MLQAVVLVAGLAELLGWEQAKVELLVMVPESARLSATVAGWDY